MSETAKCIFCGEDTGVHAHQRAEVWCDDCDRDEDESHGPIPDDAKRPLEYFDALGERIGNHLCDLWDGRYSPDGTPIADRVLED